MINNCDSVVFNYKYYIIDTIIGGEIIRYSFHDKYKMEKYIGFLHERVAELKSTLEYSITEERTHEI